jgi:hypothetical protein
MGLRMKMHLSKSELQHRAPEALRQLLAHVSSIKLKEFRHEAAQQPATAGFVAHVDVFGRPHILACEVSSSGQLTDLEKQLEELHKSAARFAPGATPVLIAPYLSPEAQAMCKACAAGFLDLEGNARIAVGEVFIGKRTLSSHHVERPPVLIAEAFSVHASSASQAMLSKSHREARPAHHVRQGGGTLATA